MRNGDETMRAWIFVIGLLGAGCVRERQETFGRGREREAPAVETVTVERKVVPRTLEVTVSLSGRRQVEVFSRVAGRVSFIGPREGERVTPGRLLFKVDRSDPGENFLATPIESPIAGWVGQWRVTSGTQITTQEPVVLIVDDEVLRATVSLPVSEWTQISKQTKVTVNASGGTRPAKVATIASAADPSTGRGSFDIEIANGQRDWKAGMPALARIELDPRPRLLVPARALSVTDQGSFIYTVDNGMALRNSVTYTLLSNDTIEILTGLGDRTSVIVAGNNGLTDKTPVKLVGKKSREERKGGKGGGAEGRRGAAREERP